MIDSSTRGLVLVLVLYSSTRVPVLAYPAGGPQPKCQVKPLAITKLGRNAVRGLLTKGYVHTDSKIRAILLSFTWLLFEVLDLLCPSLGGRLDLHIL